MVGNVGPAFGSPAEVRALGEKLGSFVGEQILNRSGLENVLPGLFGGGQHGCCNQQTQALLTDIRDMLSQLLQQQNGDCGHQAPHGCGGGDDMYGGCGDDKMKGGRGDDHMYGGCGDDKMKGGRGDDHMYGGCGDDKMKGGRGDDHMYGGCGDDKMKGGRGDDHMYGGCGDDKMKGGRGDDYLYGGAGHNYLSGGRGNDTYVIENGSDNVISDGRGNDKVKLDGDRDDFTMERDGDDLILTNKEDGTRVVIKDQYAGKGVDSLEFNDGTFDDFDGVGEEDCGCEPTPPPSCADGHGEVVPLPYPILQPYDVSDDQGGHDGGDGPGGSDCGSDNDGGQGCSV